MNRFSRLFYGFAFLLILTVGLAGCKDKKPVSYDPGSESTKTGAKYNTNLKKQGEEFTLRKFEGQPEPPGMVFIEGGRHILGTFEEDLMKSQDAEERTVTIASFYMDETEVANVHYLEYLFSVLKDSSQGDPNNPKYKEALPDTLVWAEVLAFNDPYVDHYFRYPGFRFFPVVGISWRQAQEYCRWRTDAVNQELVLAKGTKEEKEKVKSQRESGGGGGAEGGGGGGGEEGRIPLESGIVLPSYRLPTEAEWEYAAKGLIGTQYMDEMQDYSRLYPWDGHSLRNPYGKQMGQFLANFRRGRGDYAGISGKLNDGAMITEWIYAFPPNDYGLYNMAGNVNEWVEDIYRPLSHESVSNLNPARTDGMYLVDSVTQASNPRRFKNPDLGGGRGAMTTGPDPSAFGSLETSTLGYMGITQPDGSVSPDGTSLMGNHVRVYKGGSWADGAYWLAPGTRRYLEQDSSTSTIGFRCAMIRAGTNH